MSTLDRLATRQVIEGVEYVSILIGQSYPFARAFVNAWSRHVKMSQHWRLSGKALMLEAALYDRIVALAREELETAAAKGAGTPAPQASAKASF